jgi:MinD-like ATPase involved in chromosome partitioning or flagellar assembly
MNNKGDSLYLAGGTGLSKMAANNGKLVAQLQNRTGT